MSIKEKIMATAAELFLEKGIHGTSTKSIVTAAGVSNGALFNYFDNKDDLVVSIYQSFKDDYRNVLYNGLNTDDGIRKFLHDYWNIAINWSINNPMKKQFLLMFALQPYVEHCMQNYDPSRYAFIIDKINKAIADEEIVSIDHDHFAHTFMGITDGIVNYIKQHPDKDKEAIISVGFQQFWRFVANY